MNIWGTLTTISLIFVIYCFLSSVYHYMKRHARANGYGVFTEGFSKYSGMNNGSFR